MGALKSALTAIFNANDYTSSTSGIASKKIPVNESNGLPSGQIGMSDLASVLGALTQKGSLTTDCDTLYDIGVYMVGSATAAERLHTPTNYGTLIIMSASDETSSYIVQTFVERVNGNFKVFIRTGTRSIGYYSWKKLATTTDV